MKYYIISGEASGDMHASNLVVSIREKDNAAIFRAWGGDKLKAERVDLVKHVQDLAFMGFWEVLKNIITVVSNIRFCKSDLLKFSPDALILVDYPGFNIHIAKFAKRNGIKVFYYISPQIWAWKKNRIKQLKKLIEKIFIILPFEKKFFKENNLEVEYVGHPLLDEIAKDDFLFSLQTNKPIIALFPGSRKQEIKRILPKMLSIVDEFSDYLFVVATINSIEINFYKRIIGNKNVLLSNNESYGLLKKAMAALVTSGTATLETALFNVPQVVCYKTNVITFLLAKQMVTTKFISLVNIIMDKLVVKELIQSGLNKKNLLSALTSILDNTEREKILNNYKQLKSRLGEKGASDKVANLIISDIIK